MLPLGGIKVPDWNEWKGYIVVLAKENFSRYRFTYTKMGYTLSDIQNEAYIGFVDAINEYDPKRGLTFPAVLAGAVKKHLWNLRYISEDSGSQAASLEEMFDADDGWDSVFIGKTASFENDVSYWDLLRIARKRLLSSMHECLTGEQKTAIIFRFFYEKSWGDVAERLGCTESHAQRVVCRALKAMRAYDRENGALLFDIATELGLLNYYKNSSMEEGLDSKVAAMAARWK